MTLPKTAVRQHDGQDIVWIVRDGQVERRAVKVGTVRGDEVIIAAGIAAGRTRGRGRAGESGGRCPSCGGQLMNDRTRVLVRVEEVEKTFRRGSEEIHVLSRLNLDVPRGEFLALMGPSGSGKTTLLNLIGGLDRPTSGSVRVGDEKH